jgi:hypothetical protein
MYERLFHSGGYKSYSLLYVTSCRFADFAANLEANTAWGEIISSRLQVRNSMKTETAFKVQITLDSFCNCCIGI